MSVSEKHLSMTNGHPLFRRPSDQTILSSGKVYTQESWASDKGLLGIAQMLRQIVTHCQRQSWSERVIIAYYSTPIGERFTLASLEGFYFDQSPVMQKAFREYVSSRYGSDEELQATWQDDMIALNVVTVPKDSDWRRDRQAWRHWPIPGQTTRYRDYFGLQRQLLSVADTHNRKGKRTC
jgi:hypothetical protein